MACDNTTPDPGLADTCISIAHGALPQWWLSPAITLNGASAGATAQQPPAVNVTNVTFHRAGADCTLPAGTSGVLVAVYACVPGLAMNPADASKVKQLGATGTVFIPLAQAAAGADTSLSGTGHAINWTAGTDPTTPDGPGHKCLVAVACPDWRRRIRFASIRPAAREPPINITPSSTSPSSRFRSIPGGRGCSGPLRSTPTGQRPRRRRYASKRMSIRLAA